MALEIEKYFHEVINIIKPQLFNHDDLIIMFPAVKIFYYQWSIMQ